MSYKWTQPICIQIKIWQNNQKNDEVNILDTQKEPDWLIPQVTLKLTFVSCLSGCLTCDSSWWRPGPAWRPESSSSWQPSPTKSWRTRARRCSRPTSSTPSSSSGYSEAGRGRLHARTHTNKHTHTQPPAGAAEQLQPTTPPVKNLLPLLWGRRRKKNKNHRLVYGLLISDLFCFSK